MPTTRKRSTRSSSRRKSKKSTITTNTKTKSKKRGDEINVISILKEGVSEADNWGVSQMWAYGAAYQT